MLSITITEQLQLSDIYVQLRVLSIIYRTRAIITRGLYFFTPFFSVVYVLNKEMWA